MAGDWIKVEQCTPDKPEVIKMSDLLGIDQDSITGKLFRIWAWADQNSVDGNDMSVTEAFLDRLVFQNGFAKALRQVGWLEGKNGKLSLPKFGTHNGETAKKRAQTNRRVAKSRQAKSLENKGENKSGNSNVTLETLQKPLPEKRREEKSNSKETIVSCPKSDDGDVFSNFPVLEKLWQSSPKKSRERSSKKQVKSEWSKIKAGDRPELSKAWNAIEAWKKSEKWMNGFCEGLHLWIRNRQWENLPEEKEKQVIDHARKGSSSKVELF